MPVYINAENPKMKKQKISCDKCHKLKICIRTIDENICRPCYNKTDDKMWCMYCEICGHLIPEDDSKGCSDCNKITGYCCGALFHCQSSECTCKNCFNYTCRYCDHKLSKDQLYMSDMGDTDYLSPVCYSCKKIRASYSTY